MKGLIKKDKLSILFNQIKKDHKVISPIFKDGVIQLSHVEEIGQLPFGYKEKEGRNYYSIDKEGKDFFSYSRPTTPFKRFIHPPDFVFMKITQENNILKFEELFIEDKIAFFDIRPCDLKALQILDDVFLHKNPYPDPFYKKLRENLLIVASTCFSPTDVCFCSSFDIKLKPEKGFDLLITEIERGFVVESISKKGEEILKNIELEDIKESDYEEIEVKLKLTKERIKKNVNVQDLPQILYSKIDDKLWDEIGKRCISCTSCTQLCPTCFCFDIVEKNDLINKTSQRVRIYDSCFSPSFATLHKFNIRQSIGSRYRQWLLHKMAYWTDQFGDFGCVGCGRCITWCPSSIDITEEIKILRDGK